MIEITEIILRYVCPGMGCIMASVMFAAPVIDLRKALQRGSLQDLNPFPWTIQLGNCLGWCAYGYYTADAFVLAANLPGFILSTWLNIGAAKLQYVELQRQVFEMQLCLQRHHAPQSVREHWDASSATTTGTHTDGAAGAAAVALDRIGVGRALDRIGVGRVMSGDSLVEGDIAIIGASRSRTTRDEHETYRAMQEGLVMVPQERVLLRVLCFWAVILVWVGWFDFGGRVDPAAIVGIVVNMNLIFFYGAPLQVMQTVIAKNDSSLIHRPTLFMNYTNTTFWILYGFTRRDVLIILPNVMGFSLGVMQGILCFLYPRKAQLPLPDDSSPEQDTAVLETRPLAHNEHDDEPSQSHHHRHERLKDSVVESRNVV